MWLSNLIGSLRRESTPVRLTPRSRIHEYWRSPDDGSNQPEKYAAVAATRSETLVDIFERYVPKSDRILEVGCNVGRNLNHLYMAGYKNLAGIEISDAAVQKMKELYPVVSAASEIRLGSVEDVIGEFGDGDFATIFTMAVLVHIHPESEWVLGEIAKKTNCRLIIVEDERCVSWRHFRRQYRDIFEHLGLQQVEEIHPYPGLNCSYIARIFERSAKKQN